MAVPACARLIVVERVCRSAPPIGLPAHLPTYSVVAVALTFTHTHRYDSFNIWVVLVAVMVATMLFVVLVASMECTMFFESRVANVFACCSRGDDSAGSASTEVRGACWAFARVMVV